MIYPDGPFASYPERSRALYLAPKISRVEVEGQIKGGVP